MSNESADFEPQPLASATEPSPASPVSPEPDPPRKQHASTNLPLHQRKMRERSQRKAGVQTLTPQTMAAWLEDQITEAAKASVEESLKAPKFSVRDAIRMFLHERPTEGAGAGEIRLHHLLKKIFATAVNEKSPFQISAAKVLMEQGFGRPSAGEDPSGAASRKGGLTVVYVDRAKLDPDIPLVQDGPAPKALRAPEFLDADIIE